MIINAQDEMDRRIFLKRLSVIAGTVMTGGETLFDKALLEKSLIMAPKVHYENIIYTLGFKVSKELVEDDLYYNSIPPQNLWKTHKLS